MTVASAYLSGYVVAAIAVLLIVGPIVLYILLRGTNQRQQISKRGLAAIGGKCPVCGGKLKVVDLFDGRGRYKIGAARCTKCNHLEIFSEEP